MTAGGAYYIFATDNSSADFADKSASATFSVSSPNAKAVQFSSLAPYYVHPGNTFRVANDSVTWTTSDGVTVTPSFGGFTTQSSLDAHVTGGTFETSDFTVSTSLANKAKSAMRVSSVGCLAGQYTASTPEITAFVPQTLLFNPSAGAANQAVTITGEGFLPGSAIWWKGCEPNQWNELTDAGGNPVTASTAESTLGQVRATVNLQGCTAGQNLIQFSDSSTVHNAYNTSPDSYYTAYAPSISSSTNIPTNKVQEHIGGSISLSGRGFTPSSNAIPLLTTGGIQVDPQNVTPADGSWTSSASASSQTSGTVSLNDSSAGPIPSSTLSFIPKPDIQLNKVTGETSESIVVTQGYNKFLNNSPLIWTINNTIITPQGAGCTAANDSGNISTCTVTIPGGASAASGAYQIKVTDASTTSGDNNSAIATYWAVKPNLTLNPASGPSWAKVKILGVDIILIRSFITQAAMWHRTIGS
jgi:hypothetical protein